MVTQKYEVRALFADFRIDTATICAREKKMAWKKFKNGYKKEARKDVKKSSIRWVGTCPTPKK